MLQTIVSHALPLRLRTPAMLLALALAALLAIPAAVFASQSATPCTPTNGCFGMIAGSPFSPALNHDQSSNGRDNIVPRTLTISQGSGATYHVNSTLPGGVHFPAVYRVGIDDEDINTTSVPAPAGCPPVGRIDDPNGRLWEAGGCLANGTTFTIPASTFTQPGRYLIICQVHPHFLSGMYGWIDVQ